MDLKTFGLIFNLSSSQEMVTNDERVNTVNTLADEIAEMDPTSAGEINNKRNKLNSE